MGLSVVNIRDLFIQHTGKSNRRTNCSQEANVLGDLQEFVKCMK